MKLVERLVYIKRQSDISYRVSKSYNGPTMTLPASKIWVPDTYDERFPVAIQIPRNLARKEGLL